MNVCDIFSLANQHKIAVKRHKVRQTVPCSPEGGACESDWCLVLPFCTDYLH